MYTFCRSYYSFLLTILKRTVVRLVMDLRKRKRNFHHIIITYEGGNVSEPQDLITDNIRQQRIFTNDVLETFGERHHVIATIGDSPLQEVDSLSNNPMLFNRPIYYNLLIWGPEQEVELLRQKVTPAFMDMISIKLECRVTCRLKNVYCPFSIFALICAQKTAILYHGDGFIKMEQLFKEPCSSGFPKKTALTRSRILYELHRDSPLHPAPTPPKAGHTSSIDEYDRNSFLTPHAEVLRRITRLFEHGKGILDVTVDGTRYMFEVDTTTNDNYLGNSFGNCQSCNSVDSTLPRYYPRQEPSE